MLDPRLWFSQLGSDRAMLSPGTAAPSFTATAHDGTVVRSSELADKTYLLWFFPAAETPTCTRQGCGFRDSTAELTAAGVEVLGVSFDSVEDNRAFAEHFRFTFRLLSDTTRALGVAFGAADTSDTAYARRIAYLVDRGIIKRAYDVKDASHHAQQVLADVKAIRAA
jgi:peroxiredoxin Q/BCP